MEVINNTIDFNIRHYMWISNRANFEIKLYNDKKEYLGKFEYNKISNTWCEINSYGDFKSYCEYMKIKLYDKNDALVYDFPAIDFAGTTYGAGGFTTTMDFSDDNKIKFIPYKEGIQKGVFTEIKEYNVVHFMKEIKYMKIKTTNLYSGYSDGGSYIYISGTNVLK
ncbi:MAG: hypothetical protein Q9M97_05870 [Candidatus Gracilibacteria bacterium]|nr:hypothetical protein [Candidatus Gracilibacteria bacterium]